MPAAIELQKAVFAALAGDAALAALLGGSKIYDHAPAGVAFPYLTFGRISVFDWSVDGGAGVELLFSLNAWSKARGKSEALAIVERTRALLHEAGLELEGHRLVNLRAERAEAGFVDDIDTHHARLSFRAVVEEG
ncbi:MAG: DUF3168 domain-containing protein [Aliihoeflea sp.]